MTDPKIYGYLRVSTEKQELDNNKAEILLKINKENLKGDIVWIEEKISGKISWEKRELGKCFQLCNKGDYLITAEVSRIGRTSIHVYDFIINCLKKGVNVLFTRTDYLKIDGSIQSMVMLSCLTMCSQIERELNIIRTKEGLKLAVERGKILGRPQGKKNKKEKLDDCKDKIKERLQNGVTLKRLAEDYKVSQVTMCSYVKKHNLKLVKI